MEITNLYNFLKISSIMASEYNGIVKRKNRHLLEVARTQLIHRKILKCFWSNAVLSLAILSLYAIFCP